MITSQYSDSPLVRQPIGPTAHWSDSPLVRQPTGPTAHWSDNPLCQSTTFLHSSKYQRKAA